MRNWKEGWFNNNGDEKKNCKFMRVKSKMVFQMERVTLFSPDGEKLEVEFKDGYF